MRDLVHVGREPVGVRRCFLEDPAFGSDVDSELAGADLAFQLFVIGDCGPSGPRPKRPLARSRSAIGKKPETGFSVSFRIGAEEARGYVIGQPDTVLRAVEDKPGGHHAARIDFEHVRLATALPDDDR